MRLPRSPAPIAGAGVGVVVALPLALSLVACHRSTAESSPPAVEAPVEGASDAEAALAPARCVRSDQAFALARADELDDLEVGDAVSYPGGVAVGLVHRTAAGRVGAVALLTRSPLKLARVVDLGPTLGDAPPPRVAWRSPDLVAVAYTRGIPPRDTPGPHSEVRTRLDTPVPGSAPGSAPAPAPASATASGDATRDVALYAIVGDTVGASPLLVSQRRDDSLALDLAFSGPTGLLVWDEATSAPRGVIKAASFARDRAAPPHDLSPPDSDAELPRVAAAGSGFVVVWIARRPEQALTDAAPSEATGEPRAYGWLEMVSVDEHGAPVGPVRRLTAPGGHVSAFDFEVRPAGPPGEGGTSTTVIVVARDDGEAVDGSGGALLRVRVVGDAVEAPVAFDTDGLGRGAPSFVSSSGPASRTPSLALTWIGKDEDARFLPLDGAGSPTGRPSSEDGLKDTRPLLFLDRLDRLDRLEPLDRLDGASGGSSSILVASPSDGDAQLRVFACGAR